MNSHNKQSEALLEKIYGPEDRSFTAPISEIREELADAGIDVQNVIARVQAQIAKANPNRLAAAASAPIAPRSEPVRDLAQWWRGIITVRAFQFAVASAALLLVATSIWFRQSTPAPNLSPDNGQSDPFLDSDARQALSLQQVKIIGIERIEGDEETFQFLRATLQEQLGSRGDETQALLKLKISRPQFSDQVTVRARLIENSGKQLWPDSPNWFERTGTPQTVAAEIAASLNQARAK